MDAESNDFRYEPLESDRHIRLLKITELRSDDSEAQPCSFSLIHVSLDDNFPFEAVSYAWGDPTLNHTMRLSTSSGSKPLAITHSVFEALPYLAGIAKEETGHLWIDQLCIGQKNVEERGRQVRLMGQIYSSALRTLIWLGPEDPGQQVIQLSERELPNRVRDGDESQDRIVELAIMQLLIEAMHVADRYIHTTDAWDFNKNVYNILEIFTEDYSISETWIEACSTVLETLLQRHWFERGWVFQEYVLSKLTQVVVSSRAFTMESLIRSIMLALNTHYTAELHLSFIRRTLFEEARRWRLDHLSDLDGPFDGSNFCRMLTRAYIVNPLLTSDPRDRIFAFLSLWSPPDFRPDYHSSMVDVYTSFVRHTISSTKSIEIITEVPGIHGSELVGLPSWAPDWAGHIGYQPLVLARPLVTQFRLDAAKGFRHTQDTHLSYHCLPLRGKVFDAIKTCTMEKEVQDEELPLPECFLPTKRPTRQEFTWGDENNGVWGLVAAIDYLRVLLGVVAIGLRVQRTAEEGVELFERHIIRKDVPGTEDEDVNLVGYPPNLLDLLSFWFTLRFIMTTSGRFGFVQRGVEEGDVVAVLRGCRIPLVLRKVEGSDMYQFAGDAYIEGAMYGEVRTWGESEADDIFLV